MGAGTTVSAPGGWQNADMDTPSRSRASSSLVHIGLPLVMAIIVLDLALLPLPSVRQGGITAYAGVDTWAAGLDRLAGLGMVAAGIVAWFGWGRPRVGLLAMISGVLWLMPDVVGWSAGMESLRSMATLLAPLLTVVLAHLIGEMRRARGMALPGLVAIGAAYLLTVGASVSYLVLYDHQMDPSCWADCQGAPLVRLASGTATRVVQVGILAVVCFGALLLAVESWRWHRARAGLVRGPREVMLAAGLVFAAASIVVAVLGLLHILNLRPMDVRVAAEAPTNSTFRLLFALRGAAMVGMAVGLVWRVIDARRTAARIRSLAAALDAAPAPGSLQAALSVALNDPSVRVLYWLEHEERYVDASGVPAETPDTGGTQPVTYIRRRGASVAAVVSTARADSSALQRELGTVGLAALDNERLRAAVLFQIDELRASRVRIVDLADRERRRLERDLHDGAQQRLLAVSYDLRMAHSAAARSDDAELAGRLDRAQTEIAAAVEELRQLAHGIYPAILTEAGLSQALFALTEEAPVALELELDGGAPRCSAPVEAAAYQLVVDVLGEAVRRDASHVQVALAVVAGQLTIRATDDAATPPGPAGSRCRPHLGCRRWPRDGPGALRARRLRPGGAAMRVIVADDSLLTRAGIAQLLADSGIEVVGLAPDADALLRLVTSERPDAVIVDIRMPPTHTQEGLVAAEHIHAAWPAIGVLVLSQYVESRYAMQLIEGNPEGVGYLLKDRVMDPAVLVDALRRVCEGETVVDPTIVSRLMGRRRRNDPLAELTPREREVLALVAEGLTNQAIAQQLVITDRTVEKHMAQIFSKLGLEESPDQHRRVLAVLALLRA